VSTFGHGRTVLFERAIRFAQWARTFGTGEPTVEQIIEYFGVSRATAYGWLAGWRRVTGRPPAKRMIPDWTPRA
jgi:hypothetical protein